MKSIFPSIVILVCSLLPLFGEEEQEKDTVDTAEGFSVPGLQVGGGVELQARYMLDFDEILESSVFTRPQFRLDVKYEGTYSEAFTGLRFVLEDPLEELDDLVDEAYIRIFYDKFGLTAGFLKAVWGKGDQHHVIDLINHLFVFDHDANQNFGIAPCNPILSTSRSPACGKRITTVASNTLWSEFR